MMADLVSEELTIVKMVFIIYQQIALHLLGDQYPTVHFYNYSNVIGHQT